MRMPGQHAGRTAGALRPTRVRWHIIAFLTLITGLTYLDRLNLAIAGKYIQDEFALSTPTLGWILSAFVLGYALFQVPGGWLGDRFGPRGILALAIVWWSVCTAATGLVPHLPLVKWLGLAWAFACVRFLVGMGEAAALPNSNKIVAFWLGEHRRGIGNSAFLLGVGAGGMLTPPLIAWVAQRFGWPWSFYACGLAGLLVAVAWRLYATNRPEEHPRVNPAELEIIRSTTLSDARRADARALRAGPPWKRMLSKATVWGLLASYFCEGYPNYIYYTWFFIYLIRVRHFNVEQGSVWAAAPFAAIAVLAPLGGWFSDRAVLRLGRHRGRQSAVWLGMGCSALLLTLGAHATNNVLAVLLLALACGCNLFATPSWWATCIDLTRNFSGSLSALMNMCGNLGGWVSPILTAWIAVKLGWTRALDVAAGVTLVSGLLWFTVDAGDDLEIIAPVKSRTATR
jgi:MFS transporter, ACS family, glucarate transporter